MKGKLTCFWVVWFLWLPLLLFAQGIPSKITIPLYISTYKEVAIFKMKEHGIPASITLAQGILESGSGNSDLSIYANNHFGIKCHIEWTGETYIKDDDTKDECFRKYRSADQSFEDHSHFLKTRPRYAFLFELGTTDYKAWAHGLKKAGYATNPRYAELLIKIIEENRLFEYDHYESLPFGPQFSFSIDSLPSEYKDLVGKEDFEKIEFGVVHRKVWKNNAVRYTVAMEGDDVTRIAREVDMMSWQILRYNDLKKGLKLQPGQLIYLQPKKRKAEKDFHIVQAHESMYTISQLYAIRLNLLYKKNRMEKGSQPYVGQKLWLRTKRPAS